MVMFHSYVSLPEGRTWERSCCRFDQISRSHLLHRARGLDAKVAESARHISPERLTASQMAVKAAAPKVR